MVKYKQIFKIQRYSIHDGPGIRTTLFFQGCPLACHWCHNPESQEMTEQPESEEIAELASVLMDEIEKDLIFFDESGGGVTLSGGEPLCQHRLVGDLLMKCKQKEIHTCLDTSGFAPFEILEAVSDKADLVLFDIKIINESSHMQYTGKSAAPVLENLKKLSDKNQDVMLRFPMIPGITDTDDNIEAIIGFLSEKTIYRDIHILPFHRAGDAKYEKLKIKNQVLHIDPPSEKRVNQVRSVFKAKGFKTTIGG